MATTTGGWPYVLPTDHPLEYPALSQQLANKLEAEVTLAAGARGIITPATGYADHGNGLHVTKVHESIVVVDGQFRVTTTYTSDGNSRLIGTIPVGFRPTTPRTSPAFFNLNAPLTSGYAGYVVAQADGQLRFVLASGIAVTASAAAFISVNMSYRIGA